nr:MAG TPA: hypothetical protein [Caudoviricetes sp.]DAX80720.1 MAG TPA: hypothetical protein [Caudoviricetes sp.]
MTSGPPLRPAGRPPRRPGTRGNATTHAQENAPQRAHGGRRGHAARPKVL